jgi:hypothetical protein
LLPLQMEGGNPKAMESTTEFYQRKEVCYWGCWRILPPSGAKVDTQHHAWYVPKNCVFYFTSHTEGVICFLLFPQLGPFLLSPGLDGLCKFWSMQQR